MQARRLRAGSGQARAAGRAGAIRFVRRLSLAIAGRLSQTAPSLARNAAHFLVDFLGGPKEAEVDAVAFLPAMSHPLAV
jgi:hypothetical protein